jgi:hypothetical protein
MHINKILHIFLVAFSLSQGQDVGEPPLTPFLTAFVLQVLLSKDPFQLEKQLGKEETTKVDKTV